MTDHMLILDPPRSLNYFTPWACICGRGGCGADREGAELQYSLHLQGAWPALTEWVPGTHPFITEQGLTVWVRDDGPQA